MDIAIDVEVIQREIKPHLVPLILRKPLVPDGQGDSVDMEWICPFTGRHLVALNRMVIAGAEEREIAICWVEDVSSRTPLGFWYGMPHSPLEAADMQRFLMEKFPHCAGFSFPDDLPDSEIPF